GTNELINGDWIICAIVSPSVPRNGAFGGKTSKNARIVVTTVVTPAQINPFFSIGSSPFNSSFWSTLYDPSRGSTILSVTQAPINVNKNTDTAINNQFIAIFICSAYAGSMIAAASIVICPSIASTLESKRFALKPPETPANAAASPANGCLPNAA